MAVAARSFSCATPVDLRLTLGPLSRGAGDPTMRFAADGVWRATRTPDGPATIHLRGGGHRVEVEAWGDGAGWAVEHAPDLVGAEDREDGFETQHPVVAQLRRRLRGLRIGRSHAVVEALVPTVLEQKVQGVMARRSYARLVRTLGERAPGPVPLLLPPEPARMVALPYHVFHRFNVERRRAETVRLVARHARRLEETARMSPGDATRRLRALPGIGAWTAAEVAMVALGDADAVSTGDYHLPHHVAWALAGEARSDDARMLELLEPFRGHRGRVIRLIVAGHPGPPRFGPRLPFNSIASY
ncbi:MAG: DNA-3-methyladenine glycosylase 2 family protein [Acidimicrobiia bacterium]|nr:DNA-3-methyladenine glycosylase 2 family protein [Acidimicrobiia bacterium]